MKQKLIGLSQRYVTALRKYLLEGSNANLQPALKLGHQAVAFGLETLELARMHEGALVTMELSNGKKEIIQRAEMFFSEAVTPIEETHQAVQQSKLQWNRLNETLMERTAELAATNRQLERDIEQRKRVEAAFKKSGEHYTKLLKDSLEMQEGLRQLTHQVLAAQEDERRNISLELQDEVVQTLVGVNVRLLSLKKEARNNNKGLKHEISNTQRLVVKSAQSVRRVARQFRSS